jgi:hypothetical protein
MATRWDASDMCSSCYPGPRSGAVRSRRVAIYVFFIGIS